VSADIVVRPLRPMRPAPDRFTATDHRRPAVENLNGERTMAVPKKKTSKSKTRSRRASAWKLDAPARSLCPRCGNAKTPHTVCPSCGWYRDRVAIDVG
jgi:large subunit ribosomal protein L32